ncbi:calcineurin-like phosphoesterase [Thraustotheca clavata]|uniref:Calcineurin-like phosphoesterase n=1 Tax=Thraustotheca clavata TaxID=74557 RepID=A0A1V9ZHB4_9STRA|nr:calcineurin-like phosphoesterase [Thraustotheca clavata]
MRTLLLSLTLLIGNVLSRLYMPNVHINYNTLQSIQTIDSHGKAQLSFKILQIPDMHYTGTPSHLCRNPPHDPCHESNMTSYIEQMLDNVAPDFVVFTGDQVEDIEVTHTADEVRHAIDSYTKHVIKRKIPWAMVFGNHDEGSSMSRLEMFDYISSLPYSYTKLGPEWIGGVGNYELHINSPDFMPVFRMYFLDTGFDGVISEAQNTYMRDLALWYRYQDLSAIMFYHIPIPEYNLYDGEVLKHGYQGEAVCNGPQSGLLDNLVKMGDVKATFVGHDHLNDYCVERHQIQLCYGGGAGYGQAYGSPTIARSARVIEWQRNSSKETLTTWKVADGDYTKSAYTLFERSFN